MDVQLTCTGQHRDSGKGCGKRINVESATLDLLYTLILNHDGSHFREWISYTCPYCKAAGVIPSFNGNFLLIKTVSINSPPIYLPKPETSEAA